MSQEKKQTLGKSILEFSAQSLAQLKIPQLGKCPGVNECTLHNTLKPTFKTLSARLRWITRLDLRIRQISGGRVWLQKGDPVQYMKNCEGGDLRFDERVSEFRKCVSCLEVTDGETTVQFIVTPLHALAPGFGPFFDKNLEEPE